MKSISCLNLFSKSILLSRYCVAQLTTQWTFILRPKRDMTRRERPLERNKIKSTFSTLFGRYENDYIFISLLSRRENNIFLFYWNFFDTNLLNSKENTPIGVFSFCIIVATYTHQKSHQFKVAFLFLCLSQRVLNSNTIAYVSAAADFNTQRLLQTYINI